MKRSLRVLTSVLSLLSVVFSIQSAAESAVMNDYCIQPPFIAQSVPPLVMFMSGREHKLYYEAYNDASDIDDDGRMEITYKHSVTYYGYFDPDVCYTYDSTGTAKFLPAGAAASRFCAANQWSGNILNWLSMSRMDTMRKVLYGGHRNTDSNTTVLERTNVPHDAHSWGKEVTGRLCYNATATVPYTSMCMTNDDCETGYTCTDKSVNLIGIAASDAPVTTVVGSITWDKAGQMLLAKYSHTGTTTGNDHADLLSSYQPSNLLLGFPAYINDFNDTNIEARKDHGNYHNFFVVTEFNVEDAGDWKFVVDGDDGVELQIDSTVIASYYGGHASCYASNKAPKDDETGLCSATMKGTINLTEGYHRLIARHAEASGEDSVRVWYKKPGDASWTIFGNTLTLRSPNIGAGYEGSIKTADFISTGTPSTGTFITGTAKRHLFCSTSLGEATAPLLRRLKDRSERIWDWASKERPVCDTSMTGGTAVAPEDFEVRVRVCDDADPRTDYFTKYCRNYGTVASPTWKPSGLLQKYGERLGGKVCSKTLAKSCSSDAQCDLATEGICLDKAVMFFGMMTDSYSKNMSGGVLHKNFGGIEDETQTNGYFQPSESSRGNIVLSFDRLHTIGFNYGSQSYPDPDDGGDCGWITTRPLLEGECKNWGNPIAEMLYEGTRYIAGKGAGSSDFVYSTNDDAGISLIKPDWGYKSGAVTRQPYDVFPSCAKPFFLVLSDINTSFDGDQLPGSSFSAFSEDVNSPTLGLGAVTSGRSLLNSLMDTIGTNEGITDAAKSWFIGENGTSSDFICSPKAITDFSLARGTCPEEPTKKGSYYSAAVSYYAHSYLQSKTTKPNINTFVVALSSPVADIKVKVGVNKYITLVPAGKSISGSHSVKATCYDKCTVTADTTGLHVTNCAADAYCPSNQIVDFYVDTVNYDASNNVTHAKFRVNFEDVEQGADHDMDAIVMYEITPVGTDQVEVRLKSEYAAGSIDQVMGFVISGTTEDGVYLPVRDADAVTDADTPATVGGMLVDWSKTFSVSTSTPASNFLKSPLWYAAKWGGFQDINGNDLPDQKNEWAKECTESDVTKCDPDNYFLVVNPLMLEVQLEKALNAILARVASGTAASILNNSEGSGANLVQAVFYPKKSFDSNTEASWIGEMQNLWYFLDPNLQKTSIREDTNQNNTLNLKNDYVAQFYFDNAQNKTLVKRFVDANGDGAADSSTPLDTVSPDDVKSLWKAGRILWERDLATSPRTIYTNFGMSASGTPQLFNNSTGSGGFLALTGVLTALQAADTAEATKIVDYLSGADQTGYRNRKVTILNCGLASCTREWKLSDIVSSTPKLVANVRLNSYNLAPPNGYNDTTYHSFTQSTTYKGRGMAFVGGNDGMLHAFKLGVLQELNNVFDKAMIVNAYGDTTAATSTANLGKEMWGFIPRHSLPYLKYLTDPNYSHLYYIDRTSTISDVNINRPSGCTSGATPSVSDCTKDSSTWSTVLIGGMGFGGAAKTTADGCSAPANCVKTPVAATGYSSYFALDVTDPEAPKYLWEFPNPGNATHAAAVGTLGFSTTGPAIVKVSAKIKDAGGNDTSNPDHAKNGKWFAIFVSGPTGPIDTVTHSFKGESDQQMRIFVVDLATGDLLRTITALSSGDALPSNAFAGSLASSVIDTDRNVTTASGYYSDDAVYIGYVQKDTTVTPNTWTKGGVLRLLTKENRDPAQWAVSKVIENVGPVTSSINKLQDRKNNNLWLYFGTGRFYFKQDDTSTLQKLYGIKEPCYSTANRTFQDAVAGGTYNDIHNECTDSVIDTVAHPIVNQSGDTTTYPAALLSTSASGWYVNLDAATSSANAERVITDPIAAGNGAVFFTTFKPSADICKFGGDSLIWALRYDTGGVPPAAAMQGRALMQVSTGAFAEISLSTAFSNPGDKRYDGRRLSTPISGVPPTAQGLSLLTNPRPIKKLLHVQER